MDKGKGFNLIELLSVLAIISILAVIALPAYIQYAAMGASKACLAEVKGYTNTVMVALGEAESIPVPLASACEWITDASVFAGYSLPIQAYPVQPGNTGAQCKLDYTSSCVLDDSVPINQP